MRSRVIVVITERISLEQIKIPSFRQLVINMKNCLQVKRMQRNFAKFGGGGVR